MEQKKKKSKLMIIIPIVAVVIIAIVGIVIFTSVNKSNDSKLTQEEQLAVDYLLRCSWVKPREIELYRVWIYKTDNKYYFAYDMLERNNFMWGDTQTLFGNKEGVTVEEMKTLKFDKGVAPGTKQNNLPAKENGKQLNAEKILKAFQEQY